MFCIICGKKAEVGNFCEECFLRREKLFSIANFSLKICDCGSYYDGGWRRPMTLSEIINEQIEKRLRTKNKILNKSVSFRLVGNRASVNIKCSGLIKPCKKVAEDEKNIIITLEKRKCDNCIKLSGGYSEVIIQIRGSDKEKLIKKIGLPKNTIVEKTKHGYDIKFIKRSDAKKIVNQLKSYEIKKSFKFIGVKKGKRIVKDYYVIR